MFRRETHNSSFVGDGSSLFCTFSSHKKRGKALKKCLYLLVLTECLKIIEEVEETVEVEEKRRSSCLMFSILMLGIVKVLYEAIASGDQDLDLRERERHQPMLSHVC
jgi:hypothetical protein